jgi:hypothetical protein
LFSCFRSTKSKYNDKNQEISSNNTNDYLKPINCQQNTQIPLNVWNLKKIETNNNNFDDIVRRDNVTIEPTAPERDSMYQNGVAKPEASIYVNKPLDTYLSSVSKSEPSLDLDQHIYQEI